MGNVIAIKKPPDVDLDLVELLEELLAAARRGEDTGIIATIDKANGRQRIVSRGSFGRDEERAVRVVSRSLDLYCQRAGLAHLRSNDDNALPARLLGT
jgi:hypothetical protein